MSTTIISKTTPEGRVYRLIQMRDTLSLRVGIGRYTTWAPDNPLDIDEPPDRPIPQDPAFLSTQVILRPHRVSLAYRVESGGDIIQGDQRWNIIPNDRANLTSLLGLLPQALYVEAIVSGEQVPGAFRSASLLTDVVLQTGANTNADFWLPGEWVDTGPVQMVLLFTPVTHATPTDRTRVKFILPI